MGLFDTATRYQHKAELRESKDEILVGELIRGLSALGWNPYRMVADSDRQAVGFKVPDDPVISAYSLIVDRKSGSGLVSQKLGSRTVLGFVAEIHNKVVDPDDLATMWRTDLANLFKLPVAGEVRINHQLNRVVARTHHLVDIDQYVSGTQVNLGALVEWTYGQFLQLREQLAPLKKG
ncbi:MAG: hypothetical protein R2704_16515 [Microthrixaceae bacterium]|nr:hypothetical protein [Microthrixaceae bacterium]